MNIQRIFNVKFNISDQIEVKNSNFNMPYYGLKMSQPIEVDTVSFQARGKKILSPEVKAALARKEARALRDARQIAEARKSPDKTAPTKKNLSGEERIWGISYDVARKIHDIISSPQQQIHNFIQRMFGDLQVSEAKPKNLLFYMNDRAKSGTSIVEKSSTRKFNSVNEILSMDGMTDLNGVKTVMNYKTGKAESEQVLGRYIPLIKTGQIRLHEIELQRPESIKNLSKKEQEEFDYVSKEFLDMLEDAQEEFINGLENDPDKIILINRPLPKYTKSNYCALHMILQLSEEGSRPFEHQHMGVREHKGKKYDDKRFKYFDGKEIGEEYEILKTIWALLKADENKSAKEEFIRYVKDANLQLRKDEIQENKTQRLVNRNGNLYISARGYNLPPEYDLNTQYQIMMDCETKGKRKAKAATKIKVVEKTKKSKNKNIVPIRQENEHNKTVITW